MTMKNHVCKRDSLCVLLGNVIIPHPINLCQAGNKKTAEAVIWEKYPKLGGGCPTPKSAPSRYRYSQPQKKKQF